MKRAFNLYRGRPDDEYFVVCHGRNRFLDDNFVIRHWGNKYLDENLVIRPQVEQQDAQQTNGIKKNGNGNVHVELWCFVPSNWKLDGEEHHIKSGTIRQLFLQKSSDNYGKTMQKLIINCSSNSLYF